MFTCRVRSSLEPLKLCTAPGGTTTIVPGAGLDLRRRRR